MSKYDKDTSFGVLYILNSEFVFSEDLCACVCVFMTIICGYVVGASFQSGFHALIPKYPGTVLTRDYFLHEFLYL